MEDLNNIAQLGSVLNLLDIKLKNKITKYIIENYDPTQDLNQQVVDIAEGLCEFIPEKDKKYYTCPRCQESVWCYEKLFLYNPCIYCIKQNSKIKIFMNKVTYVQIPDFLPVSKQSDPQFLPENQEKSGTCFAHSTAFVLLQAESRIFKRKLMSYKDQVLQIIKDHQKYKDAEKKIPKGGNIEEILQIECQKKNLRFQPIKDQQVSEALKKNRSVIARFSLQDKQWKKGFINAKQNILTAQIIKDTKTKDEILKGHAVVIIGESEDYYLVRNSWGQNYADQGYFRVYKDALELTIFDVYYIQSELRDEDKKNWQNASEEEKKQFEKLWNASGRSVIDFAFIEA